MPRKAPREAAGEGFAIGKEPPIVGMPEKLANIGKVFYSDITLERFTKSVPFSEIHVLPAGHSRGWGILCLQPGIMSGVLLI
ncbi:MAG TPA: hypothetical protein DCO77_00820 [Nitrospiraceae bacterium]|nr:hypothetical protein [Nitrospiraceae bacterium]